ncbi:type 4a pilus biogenesis protein PilO [Oceanospirillum sanctuarii]|uniref:type 4a pilus biogenesis protein PilO n=1 Tax=Oceanospirillum sanctuarii TaxID=1434821 RepID=UPI000A36FA72|nr:type 4a pilus biogenesis protein PilO [Oceanospirillum sanctuarii]
MSKSASEKKPGLKELLEKLSQVDLNEIDFKNAGSWPKGGKITAWSIAVIVTAIVGYLLYLSPKFTQLEQAKNREQQLLQEYEIKAFQGANLPAYKQQMQDIQQQITRLSAQLPTQKSIPELIEQIGEQAQKYRVDIRGLKLQSEIQESAYSAQPLTLTVNGSYHNLALFLSGMTQLERIVTLHNFTLQPDGKHLILTIEAMAYHNIPSEKEEESE